MGNAVHHLWNYWHEPGLCVVHRNTTLQHMRAENRSMRPQTVIRQTRRTLGRACCQGRPHLPHLVSPVPCSCVRSPQVSDNLFSCPGPRPRHQMLRRLDITFIRWAFPKIRGFKHNCNYPPSLDDGINNGPARNNGIKKIDKTKWDKSDNTDLTIVFVYKTGSLKYVIQLL